MRPLLRALGYVWALPNTVVGLVLGALSVQRPRFAHGVILFDRAPRGFLWAFTRAGWGAITLGHVILSGSRVEGTVLVHEMAHVRQASLLGPLFLPSYLTLHVFTGYADNPFETQAVRAEPRPAGPGGARASGRAGWRRSPGRPPR
jgi:hypothetical protein